MIKHVAWLCIWPALTIGCEAGDSLDLHGQSDSRPKSGASAGSRESEKSGLFLFRRETFGGNGRTCATCHGARTGTLSPAEARARFDADPTEPLFRAIDSDHGDGQSYERLLTHATILLSIPLAPNVSLADDPTARSVVVERSIPSVLNTPALDPILMADGRSPDLEAVAHSAVFAHAEPTIEPSAQQLAVLAEHQHELFSSNVFKDYAEGGAAPELPLGTTESEKRGRKFFESVPFDPVNTGLDGVCAECHSGPMLNEVNEFNPVGFLPGERFTTSFISELNPRGLPVRRFIFTAADGTNTEFLSPDPGRALITGNLADANIFKTPSLWDVKNTAPYFHDGSAKTLEDIAAHYNAFAIAATGGVLFLTEQQQADIVAFLKLL